MLHRCTVCKDFCFPFHQFNLICLFHNYFNVCVESIKWQCQAVIKAQGTHISYLRKIQPYPPCCLYSHLHLMHFLFLQTLIIWWYNSLNLPNKIKALFLALFKYVWLNIYCSFFMLFTKLIWYFKSERKRTVVFKGKCVP